MSCYCIECLKEIDEAAGYCDKCKEYLRQERYGVLKALDGGKPTDLGGESMNAVEAIEAELDKIEAKTKLIRTEIRQFRISNGALLSGDSFGVCSALEDIKGACSTSQQSLTEIANYKGC